MIAYFENAFKSKLNFYLPFLDQQAFFLIIHI